MKRARILVATTIVAAIPIQLAASVSEDVPVAGGRAAFAASLGVDPVPERARFVGELARLLYGRTDRKILSPESLGAQLRKVASPPEAPTELVPVPLTAAVWSDAVFRRRVDPGELVSAILSDRQAALVAYGLAGLDDETLQYLSEHHNVLRQIHELSAEAFAVFSSGLRVREDRVVVPGGDEASTLWEAVVGASVTRPDRFILALFGQGDGRLAGLYDTIAHLDLPRQRFALGLWITDPMVRLDTLRALVLAVQDASGEWRSLKTQPFSRQSYDFTTALARVQVDAQGRPTGIVSRGFWARAMSTADLPVDAAAELSAIDSTAIDAAWLARLTTTSDFRVRSERLDQIAFGQRVFAAVPPEQMPEVLVATRAFRRYRMLMLTAERMGIRAPSVYAAAARAASRLSAIDDPYRVFVSTAQFQGAVALLLRLRMVGTLNTPQAEALFSTLLEVPLTSSAQYQGAMMRWLRDELRAALPKGDTMEAAVQSAIAGPRAGANAPRVQWEGQPYLFDLSAGEIRRLERIREKQGGATLDMAVLFAEAADTLASRPTLAVVREVAGQLDAAAEELALQVRRGAFLARNDVPPGVLAPPMAADSLGRARDELRRIDSEQTLPRVARAAAELAAAADEAGAQALVSLVYAMHLGDPEGAALLPGNVSLRHDFGLGQRDTAQRLRAAWMLPVQDVSPGVPWHIDGSLLGLDVAMATVSLKRLNTDKTLQAPSLTSNEREAFAVNFALINPYGLTDAGRDTIATGIERGRRRVATFSAPEDIIRAADELNMDGWRRRALLWTAANEPGRLESLFSLRELMALGGTNRNVDLDAWGTSALAATGCVCVKMPPPGGLPLVTGRRQIGLLSSAVPELNLHVARTLFRLRLPARLAKYVLSAAVLDFVDEVPATDTDDWLSLVRGAAAVPQERIEDYVAAAAADGPLVPDSSR